MERLERGYPGGAEALRFSGCPCLLSFPPAEHMATGALCRLQDGAAGAAGPPSPNAVPAAFPGTFPELGAPFPRAARPRLQGVARWD